MSTTPDTANTKPIALMGNSWSLFAALALLLLGIGLLGSLLGIRAHLEGFDTAVTGVVLACYYVGFMIGSKLAPIVVNRVGHIRVFAGLAALASTSVLVQSVAINPIVWGLSRMVTGTCLAGLYVVAESWLNASATNQTRGRLLSLYMVVVMGGIGGGQLLLGVADPAGFGLFIMAAALISVAVVPISLSVSPAPSFDVPERMRLRQLWEKSPVGVTGGVATGIANGAVFAMAPVYGIAVGMSVSRISLFMATMIVGAVVLQIPIGAWSDRVRRRRSIVIVNLVAAGAALAVALSQPSSDWQLLAAFLLGGTSFPLYSLNLSHVNDLLEPRQTIAAASLFVFITGAGSVLGPLGTSLLMARIEPDALFWAIGGVHLAVALYVVYRILVREGVPVAQQGRFLSTPARASALIGLLARSRRNHG